MNHPTLRNDEASSPATRPVLWAAAGGKGGAGRSLVVANMGIQMARLGKKVAVADLDLQGSNLHTYLGVRRGRHSLEHWLDRSQASLASFLLDTSVSNLKLLFGVQRPLGSAERGPLVERFLREAASLPVDYLVVDCGSGRSGEVLDLFGAAQCGILISTPEPTATESLFLFAEALLQRILESRLTPTQKEKLNSARGRGEDDREGRRSFRSAVEQLRAEGEESFKRILEALQPLRLRLILNQVRSDAEGDLAAVLKTGFEKFFGLELSSLGSVEYDLSVLQSIQKRRPLSQQYPNSPATQGIERAVSLLLTPFREDGSDPAPLARDLSSLDYYRLLEVDPAAPSKEIQRTYELLKQAYDSDSPFLHPLLSDAQVRQVGDLVETAYRTLIFLESRKEYDSRLVAEGILSADALRPPEPAETTPGPSPPEPPTSLARPEGISAPPLEPPKKEAAPGDAAAPPARGPEGPVPGRGLPVTGENLRRHREARKLSLEAIAEKTKIRPSILEAMEGERFSELPAPVFLKAFLRQLAACLGLDPAVVSREYLDRTQAGKAPPSRKR